MCQPDPFVQQQYLNVEAIEMKLEFGSLDPKITPQGLDEFRLVVVEENGDEAKGSESRSGEEKSMPVFGAELVIKLSQDKDVLLGVSLDAKGKDKKRAVLIFAKPEDEKSIATKMQYIPEFKSGQLRSRIMPLYMGKGTLKPRIPAS